MAIIRRRTGRPGLAGTAARTAVIAGTASAVSGKVQQRQQAEAQKQARQAQAQQEAAASPAAETEAAPAAGISQADRIQQLKDLAALRDSGALTEAEFEAEKQRILGQ